MTRCDFYITLTLTITFLCVVGQFPGLTESHTAYVYNNKENPNYYAPVTAADFLQFPTPERFLALQSNQSDQILKEVKRAEEKDYLNSLLSALMKVSSLTSDKSVSREALDCSNSLYKELFLWANTKNNLSIVNNMLLVHLGLIKCEDRKWKPEYNQVACIGALKNALTQIYFPQDARDTVNCFLQRKQENIETVTIS